MLRQPLLVCISTTLFEPLEMNTIISSGFKDQYLQIPDISEMLSRKEAHCYLSMPISNFLQLIEFLQFTYWATFR